MCGEIPGETTREFHLRLNEVSPNLIKLCWLKNKSIYDEVSPTNLSANSVPAYKNVVHNFPPKSVIEGAR